MITRSLREVFTCLCLSAICHRMQRHRPGPVWKAADWRQPASAVPGLQKHAAGRGCPLRSAGLPHWRPCGPTAPRRGFCVVGAHRRSGGQGQVLMPSYTDIMTLLVHCFYSPLYPSLHGFITWTINCELRLIHLWCILVFFHRYSRIDFLYLNAGIMPNPQVDVKAFFKGLFSR